MCPNNKHDADDDDDEFLEKLPGAFIIIRKRILDVYESLSDVTGIKPEIECPMCETMTTSYTCAFNKHIHFQCPGCELIIRQ